MHFIIWSILAFFFILILFMKPLGEGFAAVNTALTGAVDPSSINVQQPATEILKILAQDPNRYKDFFGRHTQKSSRDNQKYPLLWPLTADDINNRLAFDPKDGNTKKIIVTNEPPTQEMLWFTGDSGQPGASNAQLRAYDPNAPTDTNNFFGGWIWGVRNRTLGTPIIGSSCPSIQGSSACDNLVKSTNPYNLITNSKQQCDLPQPDPFGHGPYGAPCPSIVHCHNPNQRELDNAFNQRMNGLYDKPYPYIDENSPGCVWKTDQEAYGCCTSSAANNKFDGNFKKFCGSSFMPSATSQTSLCQPLMLAICESNWDSPACKPYLDSWQRNTDVKHVVQETVANYINSMSTRYPCKYTDGQPGTNDYTTPLLNRSCKMADNSLRDDSKDDFINNTLLNLCTIDGGDSRGGICDDILQQYCAQFTRQDLISDTSNTLRKICGCHLATASQGPVQKCESGDDKTCLTGISDIIQPNQYIFPGTPSPQCDPICTQGGTIQKDGPSCTQTVCIMNDVGVNLMNSNCGKGITISQVCGGDSKAGSKTGNCYINDANVDLINSTCGGVFLSQNCNECFTFESGKPWDATLVKCSNPSGAKVSPPTTPPKDGGGDGGGDGGDKGINFFTWMKEHALKVAIGVVLLGLLIILIGLIINFVSRTPETVSTVSNESSFIGVTTGAESTPYGDFTEGLSSPDF